jgi:hypothetical protein
MNANRYLRTAALTCVALLALTNLTRDVRAQSSDSPAGFYRPLTLLGATVMGGPWWGGAWVTPNTERVVVGVAIHLTP